MATAKSLKRLRSASSAFLEDGGSLLHGVDGLLQDLQQTLVDLQRREAILVEREMTLEAREVCLNEMLRNIAENVSAREPLTPPPPVALETKPMLATAPEASDPNAESKLAKEVADIQSTVAKVVTTAKVPEPTTPVSTANSAQRFSNHRKKRRR